MRFFPFFFHLMLLLYIVREWLTIDSVLRWSCALLLFFFHLILSPYIIYSKRMTRDCLLRWSCALLFFFLSSHSLTDGMIIDASCVVIFFLFLFFTSSFFLWLVKTTTKKKRRQTGAQTDRIRSVSAVTHPRIDLWQRHLTPLIGREAAEPLHHGGVDKPDGSRLIYLSFMDGWIYRWWWRCCWVGRWLLLILLLLLLPPLSPGHSFKPNISSPLQDYEKYYIYHKFSS